MRFFVILEPNKNKVANASHFINVERRLKEQVPYIKELQQKKVIESGPYAILNREQAVVSFIANTDSWEELSQILHEDPMSVYQEPKIHYLADYDQAMGKHANSIGSSRFTKGLEEDVRIDTGRNLDE